jgi:hypothetical protein
VVAAAALVFVAPAQAAAVTYDVPPGNGYTVKDNGSGVVMVTFDQCLAAGEPVGLPLDVGTKAGGGTSAPASYELVGKNGPGTLSFDPPSLTIGSGVTHVIVTVVPDGAAVGRGAKFHFKVVPENGSGNGQAAGVKVDVPCVSEPTGTAPDGGSPCPSAELHQPGVPVPGEGVVNPKPTKGEKPPRVNDNCTEQPPAGGETGGTKGGGETGTKGGNKGGGETGSKGGSKGAGETGTNGGSKNGIKGTGETGTKRGGKGGGGSGSGSPPPPTAFLPSLGDFSPLSAVEASSQPASCVREHAGFPVRAGQQNTLTVRVRQNGVTLNYAEVRVTGPGVRQTRSTGAHGEATFTFKPSGSGRLFIQADACVGADPVAVLPAKIASSTTEPANTG